MRGILLTVLATASSALTLPRATNTTTDYELINTQLSDLAQSAYDQAKDLVENAQGSNSTCNWSNVRIRREWNALTKNERKAYVDAVLCLQSKPALTPSSVAAGAKSRFDDFVATHINQTFSIHATGNFLSWHRYFTWLYEEALRGECGYEGTQPYWDWGLTAVTGINTSSIFDGSPYSMGSDGEYIPGQGDISISPTAGLPPIILKPGSGGGCVKSGPFSNMTVNLGPGGLALPGGDTASAANPLDWNPRCLKRDLSNEVNARYSNATGILDNIVRPQDVYDFQMTMQGYPGSGELGIHGGGHFSFGGDPGRDVYTSPSEPAFYLHHAMIDRVWWMWQMGSPEERQSGPLALSGTNTFLNTPPSANTTYEDYVHYGWAGPSKQIKTLMSTLEGPFCYVYV